MDSMDLIKAYELKISELKEDEALAIKRGNFYDARLIYGIIAQMERLLAETRE